MTETKDGRQIATIVDVAERAGVAVGTVSRFINGREVRKTNEMRIREAIKELGYQTNTFAQAMKTDVTKTIALVMDGFDEFHTQVLSNAITRFFDHGYQVTTYHLKNERGGLDNLMSIMNARKFDGVVMSGTFNNTISLEQLRTLQKPIVLFNDEATGIDIDRVLVNNREVSKRAVQHMVEMGHKRIAIVKASDKQSSSRGRFQGFCDAMMDAGHEVRDEYICEGDWKLADGYFALKELMDLPEPPTALFSVNYEMTMGVLEAMKEMGLEVAKDLSLVSFDDPYFFRLLNPSITAIAQPHEEIASRLVDMMLTRLNKDISSSSRKMTVACDVILRDSVTKIL
ncbi:LacI family DNA-binding transcriptional regulator [Pseudovibrio sp. Tun.PSC04-5.I4]|uniref:LacI family DNA-binding transcriptional regulator n=1 Tax=Pseudovibrio sp. Tun.PSC04-5.I4 TaxID=1798213 RepID=UPI0008869318|nr:LacI family DNA-binding transcriptional regulator [Pseudovibrio sp. Tun.PSC04-5.I4]SDR48006.1 transcriptional regulator, LacI family [Pseudovibrio sp. Tun.PSC04-5.I4]